MRKILIGLTAAALLVLAGRWLWNALLSDETRVRQALAGAVAAFNDGAAGRVVDAFDVAYRDTTADADRELLRAAMLVVLQRRLDGTLHRVELDEPGVEVVVSGASASARFTMTLHEIRAATDRAIWTVKVTAELAKGGEGWLFTRSAHETLAGRYPR